MNINNRFFEHPILNSPYEDLRAGKAITHRYRNRRIGEFLKEVDLLRRGFVYLAIVMDVFTRGIRGWALSRFLDHGLALEALEMALTKGTPKIHHSDQGVQYAAGEYVELLEKHDTKVSMSAKGRPYQNGYAERVIRTIKEEEVELSEYEGYWDAKAQIGEFIEEVYQKKRIHSALGYLTPVEFEEKWHRERETVASLSKNDKKTVQLSGSTTFGDTLCVC